MPNKAHLSVEDFRIFDAGLLMSSTIVRDVVVKSFKETFLTHCITKLKIEFVSFCQDSIQIACKVAVR